MISFAGEQESGSAPQKGHTSASSAADNISSPKTINPLNDPGFLKLIGLKDRHFGLLPQEPPLLFESMHASKSSATKSGQESVSRESTIYPTCTQLKPLDLHVRHFIPLKLKDTIPQEWVGG